MFSLILQIPNGGVPVDYAIVASFDMHLFAFDNIWPHLLIKGCSFALPAPTSGFLKSHSDHIRPE